MNTKTMRLPPRRVLMHSVSSNNNKRKRDDGFDGLKPSIPTVTSTKVAKLDKPRTALEPQLPSSSNQLLLAGYLAHEYLTKGTLFGQTWDPAQAENPAAKTDKKKEKEKEKPSEKGEAEPANRRTEQQHTEKEKYERYVEVASLLKEKGAHLPGIVNPTQLARFLQL
ncbi:hypothetical protein L6164_034381 [Bauhinia variegata]|uniref:Uncharacterized protein n=1 Tax=Bauhinia variegata TaxID=167791 RepID=A0ACB9KUQ2_BAUVA|nr:hypothetical protein L6164_034381 [Bauhinia variegata]